MRRRDSLKRRKVRSQLDGAVPKRLQTGDRFLSDFYESLLIDVAAPLRPVGIRADEQILQRTASTQRKHILIVTVGTVGRSGGS